RDVVPFPTRRSSDLSAGGMLGATITTTTMDVAVAAAVMAATAVEAARAEMGAAAGTEAAVATAILLLAQVRAAIAVPLPTRVPAATAVSRPRAAMQRMAVSQTLRPRCTSKYARLPSHTRLMQSHPHLAAWVALRAYPAPSVASRSAAPS